jgi:ribose transport system permease protein
MSNTNRKGLNMLRGIIALPITRAVFALLIILILGAVFNAEGSFFRWDTHRDMLRHISRYGILACGMTLVIITGGIDLAVGSILGLVSVVSAILMIHWQWSPLLAVPLCLMVGLACGSLSGALVARFRVQAFIATLAMMVFARGAAKYVSGGRKISQGVQTEDGVQYLDLPAFFNLLNDRILGDNIAVVTLVFLGCALLSWLLLSRLRPGRYMFAIGGNEEAARLSGVPVARIKILAYAMSGLFAAVAGICQAAQETQGDPEAGGSYELTAIAIVVIGGTNLMGGKGGMALTLVGALTIGYLEKILSINAVGEAGRLMLTGFIIVAAVLFQRNKS